MQHHASLLWGCPNPPGGSRNQDRDNGGEGVHSCPFPAALLLLGERRMFTDWRRNRSGICTGCNPAEPSPSRVAPWGGLEPQSSSLIPVSGALWGSGLPTVSVCQSLAGSTRPLPGVCAQSEMSGGAQPAQAAASLPPSLQAALSLPCQTALGTAPKPPHPAALSAAAISPGHGSRSGQETHFGCRGTMAVGGKGPVMPVGAWEPKPPSLGAGTAQGPLGDGLALGEDGSWGGTGLRGQGPNDL